MSAMRWVSLYGRALSHAASSAAPRAVPKIPPQAVAYPHFRLVIPHRSLALTAVRRAPTPTPPRIPPQSPPPALAASPTSSPTSPPTPSSSDPPGSKILSRIPRFLHPWTKQFIHAPVSHVTAFLVVHELTAIVPLVAIWYVFHHYNFMIPMDLPHWAIQKGTAIIDKSMDRFDFGDYSLQEKARFIMEGAYAYVIVKALFPVRIFFSLATMPFFARYVVIPFTNIFRRKKKAPVVKETEFKQKKVAKPRL